ncbi:MAG: adenylate/guanylate cyclase domain-containing protein [Ferruginibacter sp.]
MLSPKTKNNIGRVVPFALIWVLFSFVYSLLERGLLGHLPYYPSTGNPYNFGKTISITVIIALVLGLFIGAIEILYINKIFLKRSFTTKIICKTIIYLVVIILFLLINTIIFNAITLKTSIFNPVVWDNAWAFFSNFAFLSVELYIAVIIGVSLFYTEVSENLGQSVLNNFFTGKYHRPVEEERIFMFLDMKSSTTIAENIGHVKYFEMLREYFSDLTDPIIRYSGEIYQYVGDEIVVSWKIKKGLENNNCVACFFAIKAEIKKQGKKYHEKFGLSPGFKAGFHLGKVTTGEIGVIKKDIIFTGDVLNTTARIQGLCNFYKTDLLISGQLIQKLAPSAFIISALGENELRGRGEKIELFTIQPV